MRWDSPPERVPLLRSRVRYPSPTLFRNSSLSRASLMRFWHTSAFSLGSWKVFSVAMESSTGSAQKSCMLWLAIFTLRISGLSRLPSHVLQCCEVMNLAMLFLTVSLSVSRNSLSTVLQRPS